MPTRVDTLGRLAIRHDDEELTSLPGQPVRCALLVYLAVEREASRDELMGLLWPERPQDRARHALNQTVYELRRLLGDEWATVEGDRVRATEDVTCDATAFEAAATGGSPAEALALYRGAFLEDARLADTNAFETWTDRIRARLARLHRGARREAMDALLTSGDQAQALAMAREWVELEPLDDEAQHRFIELLAAAGHRSEAIQQYERYARRIRAELEVEPLDDTIALVERIRAGAAAPAPETDAPAAVDKRPVDTTAEPRDAAAAAPPSPEGRDGAPTAPSDTARRGGLRWAAMVAVGSVVLVWMFAALQPDDACPGGEGCAPPPDPSTFLVFPPRTTGDSSRIPATTYAYHLREELGRWRDLSLADPLRVADALRRRDPTTLASLPVDTALAMARELGAGRAVLSMVSEGGDSAAVEAQLYDAVTGNRLREARLNVSVRPPDLDGLWALAAALVTPGGFERLPTRSSLPTSLAAHEAYAAAVEALTTWNLDSAATRFQEAVRHDTTFADAYLRLAQSLDWAGRLDDAWVAAATRAARLDHMLDPEERLLAQAELALAEERYPDACALFQAVVDADASSFAGWYGLGECRARDDVVVEDPTSPSGYAFRSSYHTANLAYLRALEILPSFSFHAFRHGPYSGLTRTLFTDPQTVRTGRLQDRPARVLIAYPSLRADTLAFVPYPPEMAAVFRGGPAALDRNRETLRRIVSGWVRAFPESARAHHAWALILESFGEIDDGPAGANAVDAVRRARALTNDPDERLALTATEARLALKRPDFREARRLADSATTTWPDARGAGARYLAGLETLLGRPRRAADLLARAAADHADAHSFDLPIDPPRRLVDAALRLHVFAAFGTPFLMDIAEHADRTRLLVRTLLEPRMEAPVRQSLLAVPAIMRFHEEGLTRTHLEVTWNPVIAAQRSLAAGDTAHVRDQLEILHEIRDPFRPGDFPVHETLATAQLHLAVHDTAAAVRSLDAVLETLFTLNRHALELPHEAAALIHSMALRARLAARTGDPVATRRWSAAVAILWAEPDPALRPFVQEMQRLAETPSISPGR